LLVDSIGWLEANYHLPSLTPSVKGSSIPEPILPSLIPSVKGSSIADLQGKLKKQEAALKKAEAAEKKKPAKKKAPAKKKVAKKKK
jgi:hypothetical protein